MRYLDGPRPRIFGHRGAAGVAPENTLPSFEAGIASGAGYLELDVHATRDGHVVVFHDATVDRTTNGTGAIRDLTLAELRALDAGYRFEAPDGGFPFRGRGIDVPLLAEVLSAFPDVPLNIEIKQGDPAIEAEVLTVLDRFDARQRTLLAADAYPLMARIRAAAPDMVTGMGSQEVFEFLMRRADPTYRPLGVALQIPAAFGWMEMVTAETVAQAHAVGLEVHVWTVNEEVEMERLLDLGVDGLISDVPGRAVAVVKRRAA